jgi:hypothetical protein
MKERLDIYLFGEAKVLQYWSMHAGQIRDGTGSNGRNGVVVVLGVVDPD